MIILMLGLGNLSINLFSLVNYPLLLQIFLFLLWFFFLKKFFRLNNKNSLFALILGILSWIALILSYMLHIFLFSFFYNYNIIILLEEIVKIIPCVLYIKKYNFNLRDSIGFGSLVALGFSFIENISYLSTIEGALFRGTISSLSHIIFTIISVYGVWISIRYKKQNWVLYLFLSFFLHWVYNFIITIYNNFKLS